VVNGQFVTHAHDFNEIVLVLSGEGEHLIGEHPYPLKAGDACVIKGKIHHGFRNARELRIINLMYDPGCLMGSEDLHLIAGFDHLFVVQPEFPPCGPYPYTFTLDEQTMNAACDFSRFLICKIHSPQEQDRIAVQYCFRALTALLAEHCQEKQPVSEKLQILARAVLFLRANLPRDVRLSEIAAAAAVSPRQLQPRLFLELRGCSPMQYRTGLRLEQARSLLRSTDAPVKAVAEEVGIADAGYFSRLYRRHFGISAGEDRGRSGGILPAPVASDSCALLQNSP
jgi:AraC-like DNA-binding protein